MAIPFERIPEAKLAISSGPHIHKGVITKDVMQGVVLGLLPCIAASIFFFGWHSFAMIVVGAGTAMLAEWFFLRMRHRTLSDGSAAIAGTLLALTLPPHFPLWMVAVGSAAAIIIGKQMFGGLGYNIFNPALVGRAILAASYPVHMTSWTMPFVTVTSATPLAAWKFSGVLEPANNLLWGNVGGCIGETSAIAILVGGIYILVRRHADWRIPIGMIGTVAVASVIATIATHGSYPGPLWQICSGGLLFGALFMATDPVTTPITKSGRWLFGVTAGAIVLIIRTWGGLPEGVMYSILLMNGLTPLINRLTLAKPFGYVAKNAKL